MDVYDALTSARSYRPAWPAEEAMAYLRKEVEKGRFLARYVEAFLDTLSLTPVQVPQPAR